MATTLDDDSVERPSPGAAPSAFRIWRAGENPTEIGMAVFSRRSADALMQKQAERGVLFPIDVEHLSMKSEAPIDLRKAVGWHRLALRGAPEAPELWAVDVEWSDEIKAGLEKSPPEWRYVSPVYTIDDKTREVTDYINLAVTNTPATWNVTALAASARSRIEMIMVLPPAMRRHAASMTAHDLAALHRHCVRATKDEMAKAMSDAIKALTAIASDDNRDPDMREKAKRALEALQVEGSPQARQAATAALGRVAMRARMAGHMRGGVANVGTRQIFHTMTPAEARRALAARGGAR